MKPKKLPIVHVVYEPQFSVATLSLAQITVLDSIVSLMERTHKTFPMSGDYPVIIHAAREILRTAHVQNYQAKLN